MTQSAPPFDPVFPNRPWTVCFYSFRGGVGRTTLAVNTALGVPLLTHFDDPERVNAPASAFLLDFDLEAPGVDEFECMQPPTCDQPGLVEYIREYLEGGEDPDLHRFVYTPRGHSSVHVMRAGRRDRAYCQLLESMDWGKFYSEHEGQLFFENLRAGVHKEFGCRFMIVDSRTGLTDIGRVCTGHLADAVVLLFQPTTAHQKGLIDVVQEIRRREQREERPIPRLYVASKVPWVYESEPDSDTEKVIDEIALRCEEGSPVVRLRGEEWGDEWCSRAWVKDPLQPAIHSIPFRERVKAQHAPDSYVVKLDLPTPTELQALYAPVVQWVTWTRAAVATRGH